MHARIVRHFNYIFYTEYSLYTNLNVKINEYGN